MREKLNNSKRKVFISCIFLIIITVCAIVTITLYSNKEKIKPVADVQTDTVENIIENKKDANTEIKDIESIEDTTISTPVTPSKENNETKSNTNNNSINSNTSKTETSKTNNTNSNSNSNSSNESSGFSNTTPAQEQNTPVIEQVDLTKEIDTTNYLYSTHKGKIEFPTKTKCELAGDDIKDLDLNKTIAYNKEHQDNQISPDINYYRCIEVMSKANTVMGYYLNIFCESGNCNSKYKSTIDMSLYQ